MSNDLKKTTTFDNALDEDDFGLIISSKGELKGLWIPEGKDEDPVPDTVATLLIDHFGIDPNLPDYEATIH